MGALMRVLKAILGTVLALVGSTALLHPALAAVKTPAAVSVTLVVGDSLSAGYGLETGQGWVSLMAARMAREFPRWNVVNASVTGDTTAGGLARLPALLARDKPRVVIIELGGNDALRGLSLSATRANLAAMAKQSRAAGARVLLLGMQIPPNYGPVYTERFAAIYPAVARAEHAALVPFFLAGVADHPDWFQPDNIHPTAQAQPVMLDNVWRHLRPLLLAQGRAR
ncbi:MAG: arylesterase [Betaproteobacteria bacterium]|nr:arylesterase [Betaproteobacteria bacterium]